MKDEKTPARAGYHHGRLREALLAAGRSALVTAGPDALSLRALAREVGVSANAVYRHFENRDDLLDALAAEGFARFADAQRVAIAKVARPRARLRAAGRAYIAFATREPVLFRMMFDRVMRGRPHPELKTASRDALSILLECARTAIGAPDIDERTRVYAAAAWGLVHGLSELSHGGQLVALGMDPEVLIDRVMRDPAVALGGE